MKVDKKKIPWHLKLKYEQHKKIQRKLTLIEEAKTGTVVPDQSEEDLKKASLNQQIVVKGVKTTLKDALNDWVKKR